MQLKRQFERRGPLWLPKNIEHARYERYKKRFAPKLGFTHVQGTKASSVSGLTTINIVLGAAPTTGNLVCVGFAPADAVTNLTVKDSNNNNYTVTPNSPSTFLSGAGQVWMAYLVNAPANATATITLAWTTSSAPAAWAGEFSCAGGTYAFDKDVIGSSGVAGTTINTPVIVPTGTGELLFATAAAGGTISAPTPGATLGVWTGAQGVISNGDMSEYDLSASASTAVQFTQSSGVWSAMSMAFSFTPSGGFTPDEDFWDVNRGAKPDSVVTVF